MGPPGGYNQIFGHFALLLFHEVKQIIFIVTYLEPMGCMGKLAQAKLLDGQWGRRQMKYTEDEVGHFGR